MQTATDRGTRAECATDWELVSKGGGVNQGRKVQFETWRRPCGMFKATWTTDLVRVTRYGSSEQSANRRAENEFRRQLADTIASELVATMALKGGAA